ncbi:MAG: chromosome segregation protein SMC [Opitutales bacterium]
MCFICSLVFTEKQDGMYLKQIEIRGFKSFADKTVLKLFPGMTAVVGPNGCGKSNIVDAIRWVLGEQSAKALRGSSMQDVIFEGTEKRKGLPTAEVILTFTDCEKELGTAYNEVEVSRRVTREGGSDYYINGKIVRLKDVQRLFANTGVGRVSYSFMLQGQIDQILSTNASERRTIFEEAAGITLYKSQRKEALNKLALVETNLNRVTDVIEEVGRQINSLKRQASKALRYRRIEHRYKHLDLALSAKRYSEFSSNMQGSLDESAKLSEIVKKLTDELSEQEAQLLTKKQARQSVSEKIQAQQQKVYDLRSEKENASNQSELFSVRTEDSLALIENFKKEIATLESELTQLLDRAKEEAETKQKQLNLMGDSDLNHQNQETEFVQSQEKLNALEAKLHSNRNAVFEIENTINRARSDSTSFELEIKTYQVKHADLIEKLVTYKQEIEVFEEAFKAITKQQTEHSGKLSELEMSITQAQDTATSKLNEFRQLQERYQQADRAIAKKTAHLHVLQNLQAKFEGFAEGAKSILSGGLGEIVNESSVAIISKAIRVPQEYTLGLQTLLGMAVDALYIEDSKKSIRIIRELNEKQLGRVCLQIDASLRQLANQMDIPSHIVKVGSIVQISEKHLESTITKYLEGCYFAETLDGFIDFWTENPNFQFTLVATKNGELIDARGLIYGGAESGKKSAGVLERSSEIQELEKAIAEDRKELNAIREEYEQVEDQRNKATAEVESLREALTELNKVSAAYESDGRAQKEKIERTVEAREKTESSLKHLDQEHSTLLANAERSKADLETAETAYKRLREENEQCEKDIVLVRQHLETQRESLANVRLELAEKRQRLLSADEAIERAQGEKNSLEARISRRNQEINSIEEQIRKYREDSAVAEAKAQEIELTQNSVLSELETNKAELKELDLYILSTDEGLSSQRNALKASEKSLNEIEVSLAERRTKISFLKERIQTDYQLDLTTVDWQAEYWEAGNELSMEFSIEGLEDFDLPAKKGANKTSEPTEEDLEAMASLDWEAIEAEVNECKGRITSMGPVNVDSIGEYADLKERYDFLKEQSQDLWESKNLLVKSIDEINATSLSMFKETFDQVRENFIYTYDKLSGGGTADLRLIDSEDPLESGIDIIARPPGTRLKNVTLLSGGQRTMTAVALLFAIYLVKPSPFCVLDEIDAALDDANIGRFCETLRDFTSKSQFLIITHNKRTISNADTVFGVTMPEKGVSTLISMRFNKNDETQMISLS